MKRKKLVAANWKMNLSVPEGEALLSALITGLPADPACDIVVAPPFTHLAMAVAKAGTSTIQVAAQHCHEKLSGAYTGEVSAGMIRSLGVRYVIAGHSERRQLFHEDNETVRQKVQAILESDLKPIFCCGEPLDVRLAGHQLSFVRNQLAAGLFSLPQEGFAEVIIAYEPVWAIGTGVTATPEQAQEMHAAIRAEIALCYGPEIAGNVRILYGGSVNAGNASSLFSMPDVDGGLVGGASLDAPGFLQIIRAACG